MSDGQREFFKEEYLFKAAYSLDDLDQRYDVVIWGDSFSRRKGFSWVSYLAELTGWKIIQFSPSQIMFDELMASEQMQRYPPALTVIQLVERNVVRRLIDLRKMPEPELNRHIEFQKLALRPFEAEKEMRERRRQYEDLNERFAVGVHYLKTLVGRAATPENHAVEARLLPDLPRLFSSREHSKTLILYADYYRRTVWSDRLNGAGEGLRRAAQSVRALGSEFALLVFPDKLTVYADYLQDSRWRGTSFIPKLAQAMPITRLDKVFAAALENGAEDLYPANNTHTNSYGSRLAAETFLEFLEGHSGVKLHVQGVRAPVAPGPFAKVQH